MLRAFAAITAAAALGACTDPVDRAAKERIFSPEDPPRAVASAAERLPPEDVASDPRVARRVLGMGAAEATERLGPHKYTANVSFEWTAGKRTVKLQETRTLIAGRGGFDGDFHAIIENDRNQGLEVIRVGGDVYARHRFQKFRHRKRDRGVAERERDEVYGAIRDFDALFRGRLALKPVGTASVDDRTVWRYTVSLAPDAPRVAAASTLPPPQFAKGGPDADTQRRLRFFDHREPLSLSGEVMVDAETSVVLEARLEGVLQAPGDEGQEPARLRLVTTCQVTDIGKDPGLTAPKEFLPDEDKPQGLADALDRFGISRGGTDGGTPATSREDDGEADE
ncbi:MAG: hypothetical protein IRZ16_11460 [Myxococcaceae bacterium]|nr:hypothetical protein [Myxococcaceae bacterium]